MTFTSLGRFRSRDRIAFIEAMTCGVSPVLALFLRGVDVNDTAHALPILFYWIASFVGGLAAVYYLQISKSTSGFIAAIDLIKVLKIAFLTSIAGAVGSYLGSHLQFVPRVVPVIHFFLFTGFMTIASVWRSGGISRWTRLHRSYPRLDRIVEHQLLVGCTPLSLHYAALIDGLSPSQKSITGIVSINGDLVGTSIAGRTVLGPIHHIEEILAEYKNHGIDVQHIIISTPDRDEQRKAHEVLFSICDRKNIKLSYLRDLLHDAREGGRGGEKFEFVNSIRETSHSKVITSTPSNYLLARQRYEWIVAVVLAVCLAPFLVLIGILTYLDVGAPVIFWQKRVGRYGHMTTVHKFRTLSHMGSRTDAMRAPSLIGRFLQKTRLDELPQIFDVVEQRLSFIGPRPLLPDDLPSDIGMREAVQPGVTGWAQVHGGKNVMPEEKIALDDWYIRNATFLIDIKILLKTIQVALRGNELRDESVIQMAISDFNSRDIVVAKMPEKLDPVGLQRLPNCGPLADDLLKLRNSV